MDHEHPGAATQSPTNTTVSIGCLSTTSAHTRTVTLSFCAKMASKAQCKVSFSGCFHFKAGLFSVVLVQQPSLTTKSANRMTPQLHASAFLPSYFSPWWTQTDKDTEMRLSRWTVCSIHDCSEWKNPPIYGYSCSVTSAICAADCTAGAISGWNVWIFIFWPASSTAVT